MEGFLRLLQRAQNPLLHLLAAPVIFWEASENGLVQVPEGKKKLTYRLLEKRQQLLGKLTFRQCGHEGACARAKVFGAHCFCNHHL